MPSRRDFDGIRLVPPADWEERSVFVLRAPTTGAAGFKRNLTLTKEPCRGRDLARVAHDFQRDLMSLRPADLKLGDKRERLLDGLAALDWEVRHRVEDKGNAVDLVRRQIFVIKGDQLFSLTYADTAADYAAHKDELEALLASITFA
jgi:hypothetical protein